ncbi:MAG: succinate dehydrogenase/fumarate reductase iron-sulfur subunit [Rhizobiaceae bacterium]|nr:succinate dehydrogenase/fumarate reductase iron-sulfur subunit [Rhizobiaceae bacterium]
MKTTSNSQMEVRIWRGKAEGAFSSYHVPVRDNQTILDVVTEIQREQEPALAYRFACRVGVCGSCAMTVNGKPRWTCRTHVTRVAHEGVLTIEPLRNLPRIKDLVCDMGDFFQKWQKAGGKHSGSLTRADKPALVDITNPARVTANAAIECINCAICYSACDVVAWDKDYLGPAALNRAWTLVNDERHSEREETFDKSFGEGGCGSCHSQGNCTRHCPVEISPSESIAGLKRAAFSGLPKMDGN